MSEIPINSAVCGDCLDVLRTLPDGCIDAVITDPPYGLSFMGKKWDYDVPDAAVWRECLRVLKDGGRLLAFSGARTQHRMVCNIEDAGFTIEDCLMWLYGSGFPKHASKLKPAYEPVCVARKGRVTNLHIDAVRIETDWSDRPESWKRSGFGTTPTTSMFGSGGKGIDTSKGRWPANVALDATAAAMLDAQSGELGGSARRRVNDTAEFHGGVHSGYQRPNASAYTHKIEGQVRNVGDAGGASRFFYCAKADSAERNAGCGGLDSAVKDADYRQPTGNAMVDRIHGCGKPVTNNHPTVKPVDLMRWLVRLVAAPDSLILDPFAGSGTTGIAAIHEGANWLLVEREAEYLPIIEARIAHARSRKAIEDAQPALFVAPADTKPPVVSPPLFGAE